MKKIIIMLIIVLLIGCEKDIELTNIEQIDKLIIQWGDGNSSIVTDQSILNELVDTLEGSKLVPLNGELPGGYLYFFDIKGDSSIRITNGYIVSFKGKEYTLTSDKKDSVKRLLDYYIPVMVNGRLVKNSMNNEEQDTKDDKVIETEEEIKDESNDVMNELDVNELPERCFRPERIESIDLDRYSLSGLLRDGTEIYYHSVGDYYKREMVDEIIYGKGNSYILIHVGDSSLPQISPDNKKFMFVHGVGFEVQGNILVYENEEISFKTFDNIKDEVTDHKTIKDSIWYDHDTAIAIIGYDHGTVTQGGEIYFIDLETDIRRKLVKSIDKQEFLLAKLNEDSLEVEFVHWLDDNYETYEYFSTIIDISTYENMKPITVEIPDLWAPWNLHVPRLTGDEIANLPLFNSNLTRSDFTELDHIVTDQQAKCTRGNVTYLFTEVSDKIWRIDIEGETEYEMPRDIRIGQTVEEVLNKFPHEKNYLNTDGNVFYGEFSNKVETQGQVGSYNKSEYSDHITIITGLGMPSLKVFFEDGIVIKIEVYFYVST